MPLQLDMFIQSTTRPVECVSPVPLLHLAGLVFSDLCFDTPSSEKPSIFSQAKLPQGCVSITALSLLSPHTIHFIDKDTEAWRGSRSQQAQSHLPQTLRPTCATKPDTALQSPPPGTLHVPCGCGETEMPPEGVLQEQGEVHGHFQERVKFFL